MKRRHFTKICTSLIVSASTSNRLLADETKTNYRRSLLYAKNSTALDINDLAIGEAYLFFYPYVTTPCLLINLGSQVNPGTENANNVQASNSWRGGVGMNNSIVAYSAICSHKMTHPAKEISFINYRHEPVSFYSHDEGKTIDKSGLISCCSERSVYDPAQGARVLGGPAPQPLAAIELEYNESTNQLYATGSYGADMYDRFFEKFGFRASMEHKIEDPKTLSTEQVVVQKLSDYSKQTIKC